MLTEKSTTTVASECERAFGTFEGQMGELRACCWSERALKGKIPEGKQVNLSARKLGVSYCNMVEV